LTFQEFQDYSMDMISVIVVDDHPLFRQGTIDTLSLEADINVVGEASNGEEALQLIREIEPQVGVIDVNLPGLNGQQITHQVVSEKLATRIILLTAYHDVEQRIQAIRVGAAAYCTKDIRPDNLVQVVRDVAAGKILIAEEDESSSGADRRLEKRYDSLGYFDETEEPYQPLSPREMEVLSHVTRGLSNKEIAILLGISHQTVKNHVTAILRKLGVEDRTQAALYALRRGWVRLHGHDTEPQE
jgi:two-component system response regulator DegU